MTGLTYETVSRFAQQVGTLYFGAMFLVANAILIALLLAFPQIALWLPSVLY